ncbi:MAG: permease-like cell division protein FtsX [Ruminococcus sp.]|nr:permease-like cell division protein FtsX [Ruminococcus sp.]MDE6678126.1 permease-like cell division protein FtsX [Ruminococcus sp.]
MKLSGFKYLADQGVENIWKNKMMAFATFCVLLISLLLVGVSALFYININSMITGLNDQNEIAVYLNIGTPDERVAQVQAELTTLDNINNVEYISKQQALERMQGRIDSRGRAIFNYIEGYDFMPDGFSVTIKDISQMSDTTEAIAMIQDVQEVNSSTQVAEFLIELRRMATLIAGAVIIALSIVSMIMISNTTKASVYARREEIQIMKYVGATNIFIRMPFFVEGMVTGFFSGTGAFFITWAIYRSVYRMFIAQPALTQAFNIGNIIPFSQIRITVLIGYLLIGAVVGAVGSVISTRKHINV